MHLVIPSRDANVRLYGMPLECKATRNPKVDVLTSTRHILQLPAIDNR